LNLAHAHLLAGQYAEAVGPAHEALELAPNDTHAQVVHAVAMHAFGRDSGWPDATDSALERLSKIDAGGPSALAAWNRAAIEAERGRTAAAEASWRRALELEPRGEWADIAREHLGREPTSVAAPARAATPPSSPIPLGKLGIAHTKFTGRDFAIGTFRARVLSAAATRSAPPARALALRDSVELVESGPLPGLTLKKLEGKLGKPLRVEAKARGSLHSWPGLLVEEIDGRITAFVWSTAPPAVR
jgi:tetratricopeptide (TPR) repeat protein